MTFSMFSEVKNMYDIVKVDIIVPSCCASCSFLNLIPNDSYFCPFKDGDIDDYIVYQNLIDPNCELVKKYKEQTKNGT